MCTENQDLAWRFSVDRLATAIADKLDISSALEKAGKDLVNELRVPVLNPLLSADGINGIITPLESEIGLFGGDSINGLIGLPSKAGMRQIARDELEELLDIVGDFVAELENVASNLLPGIDMPVKELPGEIINQIRNFIEHVPQAVWDNIWLPAAMSLSSIRDKIASFKEELSGKIEKSKEIELSLGPNIAEKVLQESAIQVLLTQIEFYFTYKAALFHWSANVVPLSSSIGVNGGVSAGVNAAADLRLSLISVGQIVFGGIAAVFKTMSSGCSMLRTLIDQL